MTKTAGSCTPLSSKIYISGSSGYLGKALVEAFTNDPKFTNNVQLLSSKRQEGVCFLDLEEPGHFDYNVFRPGDFFLCAAAISAPDICSKEYTRAWRVNVSGTQHLISKVLDKGVRVIFFSSDAVYGEKDTPFVEREACDPVGDYAMMKHEIEKMFLVNPLFKTLRLSYVFSRDDKFTRILRTSSLEGGCVEVFPFFLRSIVYRADVVLGVFNLVNRWSDFHQSIINFAGPTVLSRGEFVQLLHEAALPNLKFHFSEPPADFFKVRPRAIQMKSEYFASLLGRAPLSIIEAIKIEFSQR